MSISLCLIVKDEANRIVECLSSFKGIADEFVVVDTGSKDKTAALAKSFGAKVFKFPWKNDFSVARNFALKKASLDWVIMVDADDRIDRESIQKIKKDLKMAAAGTKIFSLPYHYTQSGKRPGAVAWLPRIWKRDLGLGYVYPVHEYLDTAGVKASSIQKIDAPIQHIKKSDEYRASFERNIKIMGKFIRKRPKDLRMLYYLVHDQFHSGHFKDALAACERFLSVGTRDSVKLGKVLTYEGRCYSRLGKSNEAQVCFLLAIGANPLMVEPYLEIGDHFIRQKRIAEAVHMYHCATLCPMPKAGPVFFNQAAYEFVANQKLAHALVLAGKPKEALRVAKKVLPFNPEIKKWIDSIKKAKRP